VLGIVAFGLFVGDLEHLETEDRVTAALEAREDLAGQAAHYRVGFARIKVRSSAIAEGLFVPDDNAPLLDLARVRAALEEPASPTCAPSARPRARTTMPRHCSAIPPQRGTTLIAEVQTAGRGRKPGRSWIAPAGSALLFTVILPVAVRTEALWAVPFWAALALADGVEEGCGVRLDLRWPNDADLAGRKAAGILCTSRVAGAEAHVGCGIGLNVHRPDDPAVAAIVPPPAYLSDAVPHVARETVLAGILGAMDA